MALLGGIIIILSMQQLVEEQHFSRTMWFLKHIGRFKKKKKKRKDCGGREFIFCRSCCWHWNTITGNGSWICAGIFPAETHPGLNMSWENDSIPCALLCTQVKVVLLKSCQPIQRGQGRVWISEQQGEQANPENNTAILNGPECFESVKKFWAKTIWN